MSIQVTKEIQRALRALLEEVGSALEVERRTKISNVTIGRYLRDNPPRMNETTWAALRPLLSPYLSGDTIIAGNVTGSGRIEGLIVGKADRVVHHAAAKDEVAAARLEAFDETLDALMSSDFDGNVKTAIYNIIRDLKKKEA